MTFIFLKDLNLKLIYISKRGILVRLILVFIFLIIPIGFIFFLAILQPFGYLKLIFFVPKSGQRLTFIFALTTFFTIFFYKSKSHSQLSNQVLIDRYILLQKYYIKISLLETKIRSNFFRIAYKYFRYLAQSQAFSS